MSNAPYLLPKARQGLRMGHGEIQDSMFTDGLEDASSARLMGSLPKKSLTNISYQRIYGRICYYFIEQG